MTKLNILWFRHGLRLHDNPSLHEALLNNEELLPIFIFDGETAGTKLCGYNRFSFLLECLQDINEQLAKHGGRLYICRYEKN